MVNIYIQYVGNNYARNCYYIVYSREDWRTIMEALIVFVGGGLVLISVAIIMCVASMIQDKLNAWLAQRSLNKK